MTVPGSNILARASRLLATQTFQYFAFKSRVTNAAGLDVPTYNKPQTMKGSVQPVPRRLYVQFGLDFQRNYYNVYVSQDVIDVERDVSGDQIIFNGVKLQCESATRWFDMDGWTAILCVQTV